VTGAAPGWAVIAPSGDLSWYPLTATREVETIVGGFAGALAGAQVAAPLRLLASDIALAMPERFAANLAAQRIITALSQGRISQPWRGHVALTEYGQDPDTREWLWPVEMSEHWQQRIRAAAGQGEDLI
jgi:hypothetical protein